MEFIERSKKIRKELENANWQSYLYDADNLLPQVDGFNTFTSKNMTEFNRLIYFKDGYLLDALKYEFGYPEGICSFQNLERMRRLLKEVKEADPTEETLNKVEDINKRLEDYVRNSLELRNESEKGNKGES
ncbi:hypothetical protein [Peptoniphilus timonensis]|uniref:hypothetical protein n=1 Tax=Peptoniphilus timonensis TaxID=1268254 RepID=UPI0002F6F88D|nr:hypothetical protein [Peptoniphilus timonensis]